MTTSLLTCTGIHKSFGGVPVLTGITLELEPGSVTALAGENGARMTAKEAATKNPKEMIEILSNQYNKARQEKITKEQLDIALQAAKARTVVGGRPDAVTPGRRVAVSPWRGDAGAR